MSSLPVWARWAIGVALGVPVIVLVNFAIQASLSRRDTGRPKLGVVDGRLTPCPESPNCVCSHEEGDAAIEPLALPANADADADPAALLARLKAIVESTGGVVDTSEGAYLRARYDTGFFGFRDDVEFLVDTDRRVVHVRSSSRVGYSDLGANRARVERIRSAWAE